MESPGVVSLPIRSEKRGFAIILSYPGKAAIFKSVTTERGDAGQNMVVLATRRVRLLAAKFGRRCSELTRGSGFAIGLIRAPSALEYPLRRTGRRLRGTRYPAMPDRMIFAVDS